MKTYNIKRTFWVQRELEWGENAAIKPFLQKFEEAFAGDDKRFSMIIERIYNTDIIPGLFKIILKPYQPNILWYAWNEFWARRNKVDRTNIVASMKNSEIAEVMMDFFLCNTKWIAALGNSVSVSDMSRTPNLAREILKPLMSFSTSLRTETSPRQNA